MGQNKRILQLTKRSCYVFVGHSFFKHNLSKDFSCRLIVCWRLAVSPRFAGANSAVIRCHHEGTFAPRMRHGLKATCAPTVDPVPDSGVFCVFRCEVAVQLAILTRRIN